MDKVTEVLELAKELLESEIEWCQGSLYEYRSVCYEDGDLPISACATGAIYLACSQVASQRHWSEAFVGPMGFDFYNSYINLNAAARQRFREHVPSTSELLPSIPNYNDDPGTTKEDVLMVFKRAINEGE